MEKKLSYLTDQSSPFGEDKAQLLDELTFAIKNNTPQVYMHLSRPSNPTRCGGCSKKTSTSGTMPIRCSNSAK